LIKGNNPATAKRQKKLEDAAKTLADRSASTVSELVDDFFTRNIDGKKKTAKGIRQAVDKHLIPVIGTLKIDAVLPIHISNMLDAINTNGAPTVANKILSITKRIFNHAIKRHTIIHNPAAAFDLSDAGGGESARDRFLNESEIIQLFNAMSASEKFTRHHYLVTKLLFLIGCRKSELFKAKRTDFDLVNATWIMSLDNKTESAITIPLSYPAQTIINELMQYKVDGSEYLLPALRVNKDDHVSKGYLNDPIKNWVYPLMVNVENFTIHDLRRTMRTHMGKLGINRFVAERCLNHKIPNMEGVYDAGDYLPERRAALEQWAMFLETCEQSS
jgi:integrase